MQPPTGLIPIFSAVRSLMNALREGEQSALHVAQQHGFSTSPSSGILVASALVLVLLAAVKASTLNNVAFDKGPQKQSGPSVLQPP
ncbi:Amyloid beta A4 precursor protein-binding family A member 3 [Lasiodiplodia theobromae]|uniref:Amyloid beta A4 precursor protein-binding family A member 3 n=1 Tax=Lasiodiplodia theobromae TaxID=45133 RepID=UPI0015C3FD9E|nr:Amyloid beta A4 precursor protein-binding family A member 3 [Lasiodiplodia theobromae]KAF4535415.1 Amyloid beta A4 precursor protein-binding family A member 3 [Lasiodiplodia theobromae]